MSQDFFTERCLLIFTGEIDEFLTEIYNGYLTSFIHWKVFGTTRTIFITIIRVLYFFLHFNECIYRQFGHKSIYGYRNNKQNGMVTGNWDILLLFIQVKIYYRKRPYFNSVCSIQSRNHLDLNSRLKSSFPGYTCRLLISKCIFNNQMSKFKGGSSLRWYGTYVDINDINVD